MLYGLTDRSALQEFIGLHGSFKAFGELPSALPSR